MIQVPELKLTFSLISQETPSHGDTVYFGFINYNDHVRTYCYLAQSQINEISKNHKIIKKDIPLVEVRTNWKSKIKAKEEKFFFNVGFLTVFQDSYIAGEIAFFNRFKKVPFLLFSLSDKSEIFHNQKRAISYKCLYHVRTSDFNHKVHDSSNEHKISYQIKNIDNIKDLTLFIWGEDSREARKLSFDVLWKTYRKDDFELNYSMIRLIWLMRKFFSHSEMCYLFHHELDRIKKMELYDYINHLDHRNAKSYFGIIEFFKNIPEFNDRKRLFFKFNIPQHVIRYFTEVMTVAYPELRPDISRTSDALYFYNNLSRDYGRLKLPNNAFIPQAKYKALSAYIDGKTIGDYRFEVPKDYHSMIDWGSKLCNCAGNFDQKDVYSQCLPVAIFYKNKIKWLLSVGNDQTAKDLSNLKVTQFKGYKNSDPKKAELNVLMPIFEGKLGVEESVTKNIKDLLARAGDSLV